MIEKNNKRQLSQIQELISKTASLGIFQHLLYFEDGKFQGTIHQCKSLIQKSNNRKTELMNTE